MSRPLDSRDYQLLAEFEQRMLELCPPLRGKAPIYFARALDGVNVYRWPEANLAFIGFSAGVHWAQDQLKSAQA